LGEKHCLRPGTLVSLFGEFTGPYKPLSDQLEGHKIGVLGSWKRGMSVGGGEPGTHPSGGLRSGRGVLRQHQSGPTAKGEEVKEPGLRPCYARGIWEWGGSEGGPVRITSKDRAKGGKKKKRGGGRCQRRGTRETLCHQAISLAPSHQRAKGENGYHFTGQRGVTWGGVIYNGSAAGKEKKKIVGSPP